MGPVTYVTSEVDEQAGVMEVTVLTRGGEEINSRRTLLNYAAGRAAVEAPLKQRELMAAAAETHGVTWREGPFSRSPVQVYPESEGVDYEFNVVNSQVFERIPGGETRFMHKWTIPLDRR